MRLFFRAPAFFVLRAQKVGLRRRETEACGGRTFAYAHRRAAVCAGGAGKRCAPERDFSAAEAGRRLCLRTEIYCKNGKSAAKTRWYFSCSCRLCAARFARTRRRWPVRGAVSRIAAARTCLRSARGNMRGKESKNHKRISTAFQPLRRRRQSKSESPPNRIDVCIPIHRLYNKRKVPKLSRPRRGKCTRTLCGSAISTKSRVLPRRRHGKIV